MDRYWDEPPMSLERHKADQLEWEERWNGDYRNDRWCARELQCADEESLDQLMEELENEVVGAEGEGDWSVWLEAGCRPIPNG